MKTIVLGIVLTLLLAVPAQAQGDNQSRCLESTVMFYNCLKGGTELQRNLATTYLLGAMQTVGALNLIIPPRGKTMGHFKYEYLDFVEANGSIHNEPPARGVTMYLLQTYGNKENSQGVEYARSLGLIK